MLKLSFEKLPELFMALNEYCPVFLPVKKGGQVNFYKWEKGTDYCDNALNTVASVKSMFFPQSEDLASFKRQGKKIEIIDDREFAGPFAVFGVRACDARALDILDMVFLENPVDSFYEDKRNNGTVITMACGEAEESCFCSAFGIDAAKPGGDIATWQIGAYLYWLPQTQKGEILTKKLAGLFSEAESEDKKLLSKYQEKIHEMLDKLPLGQTQPHSLPHSKELFDSEKWAKLSEACLGCGACTFICPTCQCYDVRDYNTGHKIKSFRCWDSCMYSDFTLMAHGNPRTTQMQRFRQRFMHKLSYFPENNDGVFSCVGCGRCVTKCPISMNIAKVIKVLGGQEHD